ncbi:MAG: hypothetical protein AB7I25_05705 [Vicinamibacterales bacterium]
MAVKPPRTPKPAPAAPVAFVPLTSLGGAPADPTAILAEIRRIYFKTSATTIDADLQHAVALLKTLPDEDTRERATVYMEGLNEMRKEWAGRPGPGGGAGGRGRSKGPGKRKAASAKRR